jgi:secreted trypsin-like serine protease
LDFFYFLTIIVECGRSEVRPNTRIVGGLKSIPHSWPSQVLIVQSYKGYYDLRPLATSNKTFISVEFRCGGTLIDSNTVVSAAHCVIKEFDYYIFGYVYSLKIKLNEFYPTTESMFSIYLGKFN